MNEQLTEKEAREFFAVLMFGDHHVPKLKRFGLGWRMDHLGDVSTYDFDLMTRIVFLAHDRCIRASIVPGGGKKLAICIWKREREGGMAQRHPSLKQAIETWRQYIAEDHA